MTITSKERKRQKLKLLIAEYRSRGKELPDEIKSILRGEKQEIQWKTNEFGWFYKADGTSYVPNDKVKPFLESTAYYVALSSGRGGGKTCAGIQKALKKIKEGNDGAIYNPSFENFKISTWPEAREWIPWDIVVPPHRHRRDPAWQPNQPFRLSFDIGWKTVSVICKGLRNPEAARGPNINWLWYDEAREDHDGLAWANAVASVRVGDNPQAWITTTPAGQSHWFYKFFVMKEIPEDALELFAQSDRELAEIYHTTIQDNIDNLDSMFVASLMAQFPEGSYLRRQELYGEFVSGEGSIGGPAAEALRKSVIHHAPGGVYGRVRFWDLAATERKIVRGKVVNDPDETVGSLVSWDKELFYIENQHGGYWDWDDIKRQIKLVAMRDGPSVKIIVEQEPASGGKNQVAELRNFIRQELPGWPTVEGWNPRDAGDRVMGANTWFAECVQDRFRLVDDGLWDVEKFLAQVSDFPIAKHDDKVTSVTGARYSLAPVNKWKHIPFLRI